MANRESRLRCERRPGPSWQQQHAPVPCDVGLDDGARLALGRGAIGSVAGEGVEGDLLSDHSNGGLGGEGSGSGEGGGGGAGWIHEYSRRIQGTEALFYLE